MAIFRLERGFFMFGGLLATMATASTGATGKPGVGRGAVSVAVSYSYEESQPQIINGRPVRKHLYWACIDQVTLAFDKPVVLPTVKGQLRAVGQFGQKRALVLDQVSLGGRRLKFKTVHEGICNGHNKLPHLVVGPEVRATDGTKLAEKFKVKLAYPRGRDTNPGDIRVPNGGLAETPPAVSWDRQPVPANTCSKGSTQCISVTPSQLNSAVRAMHEWERRREPFAPLYETTDLKRLPLDYLLTPFHRVNRKNHYGSNDLLYVLRRAARFTQALFPELEAIPVADLSDRFGRTPRVDDIFLHPEGSHTEGTDADVAYITTGSGHEEDAPFHFERNFWFLYGILKSTSVDLVMTAYKEEFRELAREAYQKGLINRHAVGRFNFPMQDDGLNHDKHVHINVQNSGNSHVSRKFLPSDDIYGCYLSLHPDYRGGRYNFCGSHVDDEF